jgi:hypothetical protein
MVTWKLKKNLLVWLCECYLFLLYLEEEDGFFLASAGRGLGGIGFQGHTATTRGRVAGLVGVAVGLEKLHAGVAGVADATVGYTGEVVGWSMEVRRQGLWC